MAKNPGVDLTQILKEEFSSYLSDVASRSQKEILKNFDDEKDVDGDPFAPLRPATIRSRGSANPILKRTGNLRDSIKVTPNFSSMNWVVDSLYYGDYLHDGRHNMEPRRILDLPKEFQIGGKKELSAFNKVNENLKSRALKIMQELSDRIDNL